MKRDDKCIDKMIKTEMKKTAEISNSIVNSFKKIFFGFVFGHTCVIYKFPGQGSNLRHNSDNIRSLTTRPPENSVVLILLFVFLLYVFDYFHSCCPGY